MNPKTNTKQGLTGIGGLTLIELMMVSFVLSIVMICIFRALTLFTQGALHIQRVLPAQRALQAASFMLSADLLASPRSTINNLLPNPGFEDFAEGFDISVSPTTGTWSTPPFRMGPSKNNGYFFVRILSGINPSGKNCLGIRSNFWPSSVVSPALGPAVKSEPYMFSGWFSTNDINFDAQGTVRGGINPLAPATVLGTLKKAGVWGVRSSSFTATVGHYHQVTLSLNPCQALAGFDNIYLGPLSVEVSTSNPLGRLSMLRSNGEGDLERIEYTMGLGPHEGGRLVRKHVLTTGVEMVSSIDGIEFLKVSWLGAPSATGGTDRPLLVDLVAREGTGKPTDTLALSFEVYPLVP